jgi:hypothetical protein
MKGLNLNACGVCEMSHDEMIKMEGGLIAWISKAVEYVWKAIVATGAIAAAVEAAEDFKEGWDSVDCGCEK